MQEHREVKHGIAPFSEWFGMPGVEPGSPVYLSVASTTELHSIVLSLAIKQTQ